MTDTKYEYDIFISYNKADEAWAKRLATKLEQEVWQDRKLKVFFAPWDIKPGESIPERLEYALLRSRKVGLIMSPESVASGWVNVERYVTQHEDITERQQRLIPLHLRACEIPLFLNHINRIDFQDDAKFANRYRILLAAIKDEPLPRGGQISSKTVASLPPAIPRPPAVGFVPRHDERKRNILEQVKEELAPEKNQLVVLWGRGGAGKTTLAAEAVREMRETFQERIVWISALSHADLTLATLLNEIAAQLGRADLRPLALEEKEEQVRALIALAPTLIVLDNFESIKREEQKACVRFLAEYAPCPALITTRSEINEDEVNNIPLDAMRLEEARKLLRLLVDHTRKPARFNTLDHDDIIRKTEFNPLLLRWVVRQIDLAQQPETALNYLAREETDVAERIFDRSFDLELVGGDGRDTLLALSLFVPDASRASLAEVAGFDDNLLRLDKAVENLSAVWLIDTTEEGKRLIIRGLTYERAKARLAKDTRATEFRQRFIAYFLNYAEAHAQPTRENFNRFEAEKDNLLKAMDVAFSLDDWSMVMQLMAAINFDGVNGFLTVRGYWDEAIRRGEQAAAAAQKAEYEPAVAMFTGNTAVIHRRRGEYNEARRTYQQALAAFRKLGDEKNVATCLHQLALIADNQGTLAEARQLYDESLEIRKRIGDQDGIASTLHQFGNLAQSQGELAEARRLYNESLEINKKLGNQNKIALTLGQLGILAQDQDETDEARQLYNESLEISRELGNQNVIAKNLHQLGSLVQSQGELAEARRLYDESLEIKKKLGDQIGIANTLHQLGRLAEIENNKSEAVRLYCEALSIFERLDSPDAAIARRSLARVEGKSS